MEESILKSIKLLLGGNESDDDTAFDKHLIMHINSVFTILHQLGVGPEEPFYITDGEAVWTDFLPEGDIEAVKTYVFMKVKLVFDPPANSFVVEMYKDYIKEFEWRMNVRSEELADDKQ